MVCSLEPHSSKSEDPNFEDIYYVGEVKAMTIPEIKKQFPHISNEELEKVQKSYSNNNYIYGWGAYDENTVQVLYFEYKTSFLISSRMLIRS